MIVPLIVVLAAMAQESADPTGGIAFGEGAGQAGISFHQTSGSPQKKYIVEAISGGVCLFDYDGDGFTDIYFVNGGRMANFRSGTPSPVKHALYRNLGGRRFQDVTQAAGVAGKGAWGMGCSVTDFDNDGRLDLYVTHYGSNILYRNRGDGSFEDVTAAAAVDDRRWSTGSAWADFDADGDLDLFVSNYVELDPTDLPEPGSPRFGSMGGRLGCRYLGLSVMCGPQGLKGAGDSFFVNQGDGTFRESSQDLGTADATGYYGLGAMWGDFNDDGLPDLYVANDSTPNYLYLNRGGGRLEEIGLLSGAAFGEKGDEQAGMGVAAGDYLGNGRMGIFVTHFSEDYNTLYRNEGGGDFTDITAATGMLRPALPYVGWGAVFFDADNDGRLDLFVADGHVFPQVDSLDSAATAGYAQRNLLFRNTGDGRFAEVGESSGMRTREVSRGAAVADLDNDGRLDIVVNNLDGSPTLLWNETPKANHWLTLQLQGSSSNRPAAGARVRLLTGSEWQTREVQSGGSYLSNNDFRVHFGLGEAAKADRVEIRWPNRQVSVLTDVAADRLVVVTQTRVAN